MGAKDRLLSPGARREFASQTFECAIFEDLDYDRQYKLFERIQEGRSLSSMGGLALAPLPRSPD